MNFMERTLRGSDAIPENWVRVIETIRGTDWVSFVAGGAVRDLIHGVVPKDVDIWVSDANLVECERIIEHEFPEAKVLCDSEYIANLRVRKVWEFCFADIKVNVIVFKGTTPRECVSDFDLTLSQCFILPFDYTRAFVSEAFVADSEERVFRMVRPDDTEGRTKRRVETSLLPRYPGWTFESSPGPPPATGDTA